MNFHIIEILYSDMIRLFSKKTTVKNNNLKFCEFSLKLTSKTPSNIWVSIKGSFLIKTSKVFLVFSITLDLLGYLLDYLLAYLTLKTNSYLKKLIKILKIGLEFIQNKQKNI